MTPDAPSYPVALRLSHRRCLVVGGDQIALAKVRGLLNAGADVTVVTEDPVEELTGLGITIEQRAYRAGEAALYQLVLVSGVDPVTRDRVFSDADAAGVFVNVADDPGYSSFYAPAIGRVGSLAIAVSTDGRSPALASFVRDAAVAALPEQLADVAEVLFVTREQLRSAKVRTEGLPWHTLIEDLLAGDSPSKRDEIASSFVRAARDKNLDASSGRGGISAGEQ